MKIKKLKKGLYTKIDIINALHKVELQDNKDYTKIWEGINKYLN